MILVVEIQSLVAKQDNRHEFQIMRTEPIEQLLAAADIVVTIYSNVGMEAAVLGKPLLITKLAGPECRCRSINLISVACSVSDVQYG